MTDPIKTSPCSTSRCVSLSPRSPTIFLRCLWSLGADLIERWLVGRSGRGSRGIRQMCHHLLPISGGALANGASVMEFVAHVIVVRALGLGELGTV